MSSRVPQVALAGLLPLVLGNHLAWAGEIGDLLLSRADRIQPVVHLPEEPDHPHPMQTYRRIGLERSRSCPQEPCPSYTMFLYSDDSVLYTGQGFPPGAALPNGQVIARLDATLAARLRAYLAALDHGAGDSTGDTLYGIPGTDAWAIVLLETDQELSLIVDYGHAAPSEVWALIGLLEHAAWSSLHGSEFER
ncbi:MAG: hypothetical protein IT494_05355 [Gammaproteobacteria bacterium]|nr:hypothetical protein [Gammaproteobacteria bacterium]